MSFVAAASVKTVLDIRRMALGRMVSLKGRPGSWIAPDLVSISIIRFSAFRVYVTARSVEVRGIYILLSSLVSARLQLIQGSQSHTFLMSIQVLRSQHSPYLLY